MTDTVWPCPSLAAPEVWHPCHKGPVSFSRTPGLKSHWEQGRRGQQTMAHRPGLVALLYGL